MFKPPDPRQLAIDLLDRSTCRVQVAAALVDSDSRYVSWGWNSSGSDGMGCHAEAHCWTRASRRRLEGSRMFVAAKRKKSGSVICARPCEACQPFLEPFGITAYFRDKDGLWKPL